MLHAIGAVDDYGRREECRLANSVWACGLAIWKMEASSYLAVIWGYRQPRQREQETCKNCCTPGDTTCWSLVCDV